MALTKIGIDAISGAIGTTQLENNAVTSAKIANGAIAKEELDVASSGAGTGALIPPTGTTEQRPTAAAGQLRFNTTLDLMEYYDGTNWKSIDAPPAIVSLSGQINENTNSTLTISGTNFQSGAVVSISGSAVSGVDRALTTTFVNSTQLTAATNAASVNYVGGASFDIKVTNPSGLSSSLVTAGAVDRDPTWTTSAGNLSAIYDSLRGSISSIATVTATDAESTAVTYAVTSGSLPTGISLNSSTGVISRTGTISAEASDTTYTFGITPTSNGEAGVERSFNIIVKAPVTASFTATGSSSWTVPTGISSISVLVVAGGGAGGWDRGGGGGGGGVVVHSSYPVTPAGSVSYTVGVGGPGNMTTRGGGGGNSVFGSITANGGGGGGSAPNNNPGGDGGSGGGAGGPGTGGGVLANTTAGGTGYGYPGGNGAGAGSYRAGGGGGAGSAGTTGSGPQAGANGIGGNGYTWPVNSTTYAGGGGAGAVDSGTGAAGGPGGGGAGGNAGPGSATATAGTTNRGGGGGGGGNAPNSGPNSIGANGGPGIIIVSY